MSDVRETQLLVIGGGPGGYPAALHAADHGMKVLLVDEDPKLGGVCLNRGCIPSKALLHVAKLIHEAREAADWGLTFAEPKLDLDKLRAFVQQKVVGKLTGGIGQLTKGRGVEVVKGHATFTDPHTVQVTGEQPQTIRFANCIIATGSVPVVPKPWQLGDERVMDSTGALFLQGRSKAVIFVAGLKFFPEEVEMCINAFPGVKESRVFGVPHARLGQVPRAEVVLDSPRPDLDALRAHCARALSAYKVPLDFDVVDAIARTPGGKILRRAGRLVAPAERS